MRCFFHTTNSFFKDVPPPLLDRFLAEKEKETREVWGIQTTGADAYSMTVELNNCRGPEDFLTWCEFFGIVRCDVDRVSDIAFFIGRSPISLGLIDAWQSQPSVQRALISLQPDELYTRLNELAGEALNAGSEQLAAMNEYASAADADPIARYGVEEMESHAELGLRAAGFTVNDHNDFYNPPAKPTFENSDEYYAEFSDINDQPWRKKDAFGR